MSDLVNVSDDQRRRALAQFKHAGDPERGDAIWGCAKDHEHHSRNAAKPCGRPRLVALSRGLLENVDMTLAVAS